MTTQTYEIGFGAFTCGTALQAGRSRVGFPFGAMGFYIGFFLPATLWPSTDMSTRVSPEM